MPRPVGRPLVRVVASLCGLGLAAGLVALPGPGTAAGGLEPRPAITSSKKAIRHDHVRAARGKHEWKTRERMVPVTTGPGDDIEISLDTRLYVPDNASRRSPQPAILMTHGFGLDKDANE